MKPLQTDSEIIGSEFERLTVIRRDYKDDAGVTFWLCTCKCGGNISTPLSALRKGRTRSCGCLRLEEITNLKKTHGKTETREYSIWSNMKSRCLNPKNRGYKSYGGRGITVAPEWIESFEAFIAHIGMPPEDGQVYSIDRIDTLRGYEPGNVRWATKETQANNTRSNNFITAFGKTQTRAQWAKETGISADTIKRRQKLPGWPPERILTEKPQIGRRKSTGK